MVRHYIVGLGISLLVSHGHSEEPGKQAPELKTLRERASYSIGTDIGKNMKNLSFNIDPDLLARGIKDAVTGAPTLLSKQEIAKALADGEEAIVAELAAVQGKPVDLGGYFHSDPAKTAAVMRPSATLNAIIG